MPANTGIDPKTLQAYMESGYPVYGRPPVVLRIAERSLALEARHREHGVSSSFFITAWFAHGRDTSAVENAERQTVMSMS